MAISKCVKCDNGTFEIKAAEPRQSAFKMVFVQCSSCGVVAGAMDFVNVNDQVAKLSKQIEEADNQVKGRLARIEAFLQQMGQMLAQPR